ncbi:hypothetical protein VMCG_08247 [Cytospora schulzeri]|uniref:Peptidase A1 domain-containing protein n=1 Tax=Cytospora schulzeri TaxID=448051 RepID=A0A423VSN4_9PEZI|nr:hypothetical protein VMCG_08247 [Valsa malicola]
MLHLLVLFSVLLSPSHGSQCDSGPISIPIQDTQVLPNINGSNMIGLRTQVGSPPQDILMIPWAELNNTWIYDYEPYCSKSDIYSDLICQVRRGDFFYENASSSYDEATNMVAAGGASHETNSYGAELGIPKLLSKSLDGADTIAVGSTNLTNFPIGIPRLEWDAGYTTLHALGMGSNSTFLNSLLQAGTIASRVWSIFWGRMWVDDWLDGSMVLGGYDSELVKGKNYTQALDYSNETGCWTGMLVTISDIQLNYPDGTDVSIIPEHYALPVCLVPHRQLLIEAPVSIRENFESVTGMNMTGTSYNVHWSAAQYKAEGAFDGDMTISLSSGSSIRIPNDQFLVPYVYVDYDGKRYTDDANLDLLWNGIGDQPATLGRYFLTAAYLMVNHDSNSFTLWEANPTTSSNLVSVMNEETAEACGDLGGVVQPSVTATATPTGTGSSLMHSSVSSGSTPVGAVAGGVVGGVALLAIVGLGAFFLVRRSKRARSQEVPKGPHADEGTAVFEYAHAQKTDDDAIYELGAQKKPEAYEMPLNDDPREIAGREVIGEIGGREVIYSTQAGNGIVHEMDGRAYTFSTER